ncbi:AAA family ATPase [Devosia sp. CAU 1758]
MGSRNYLIEGGSGTGKTTVAEELERRGYHVVHGDRTLAYYGDPETGEPMKTPQLESEADTVKWGYEHWIWPVERVKALIIEQSNAISFFCGHSANSGKFIGLFDGVFVLDVRAETLSSRLVKRPEDEFGGRPIEQELVMRLHETKEGIPEGAVSIDANAPVARVVDALLAKCSGAKRDQKLV